MTPQLRSVGELYHQFRLTHLIPIPELHCTLRQLIHEPSGAQIMHIENDDPENFFCLSLQTLPHLSNGVAHILEHMVLCGSEKYPVKDPFFSMKHRSLSTFMNAMTGQDYTCYPAASQVGTDFYNLLDVYLDAVFHPLLTELSFLQEGHRLEFSQPGDYLTPLEYKGVVYNEMKGVFSSPSNRLIYAINAALFPAITYGCVSGGDPKNIPELTYEELKNFYQTFYHPGRCLFFFYGNMPLEEHLDFIAQHTLNQTRKLPPLPPIPLQPRFKSPQYLEQVYPISPEEEMEDKTLIAFGWLTCPISEQQDVLGLGILELILMGTDASILKMALLQSRLCKQASSLFNIELNEIPWGIVLEGCKPESAEALEKTVKETLKRVCDEGIPPQMIENAIHQIEFSRSEIADNPYGLSLFMRSALLKQHGADPTFGLMIHTLIERLREADPRYFTDLIQKYLLDNAHCVRITLRPDPHLAKAELEAERSALASIQASLSPQQAKKIVDQAALLVEYQKTQKKSVDVLPKLSIIDIPLKAKDYPLQQETVGQWTVFHHTIFTNNIVYVDLAFKLPDLPEKDLPYLRLLTVILTQMGCTSRTYQENLEFIQANIGGIAAGINLNIQASNHLNFFPTFHLRGKALYRKAPQLFSLLHETLASARLDDKKRLKEILEKHFTELSNELTQNALKYAIYLSASSQSTASKFTQDLYGLDYYWEIRELVKNFDHEAPSIIAKLQEIQERVTCLESPHLILSCDEEFYQELKMHDFYGLKEMKTRSFQSWKGDLPLSPVLPQGRLIASPVAFIGKVIPTVSYIHPDAPALCVAACLFENLTLHPKIREQGGAYGGGAACNVLSGNLCFYSYRDPHVASTLKAFEASIHSVIQGNFDESDLEKAKFDLIQSLDSPLPPGTQAAQAYQWLLEGRRYDVRQAFRQKILSMSRDEVINAVKTIITQHMDAGSAVAFAGKDLLEEANLELLAQKKPPLLIEKV